MTWHSLAFCGLYVALLLALASPKESAVEEDLSALDLGHTLEKIHRKVEKLFELVERVELRHRGHRRLVAVATASGQIIIPDHVYIWPGHRARLLWPLTIAYSPMVGLWIFTIAGFSTINCLIP